MERSIRGFGPPPSANADTSPKYERHGFGGGKAEYDLVTVARESDRHLFLRDFGFACMLIFIKYPEDIMKQTGLVNLFKFIMRNFIDLATIAVAGYVVIRHQVSPFKIEELAAWLLAILALMAISGLWERNRRLDKIEKLVQENHDLALKEYGENAKAHHFFANDTNFLHQISKTRFDNAKQIYLSGMSLRRTIRTLQPTLEQRLIAGVHVRVIILDGKSPLLMEELTLRSAGAKKAKGWREVIENANDDIQTIVQRLPKNAKGTLEVGFLPYIPSFGMVLINANERNGYDKICYVEIYHHRSTEANPTFVINYQDDETWFKFYASQYDLLWKSCVDVEKYPENH